jgi:hypothetical protein
MHKSRRSSLAAVLVILTTLAACGGDSTGPTPTTNLAAHFDTLYVAAKGLSAGDTNYNFRATALSDLELPAAFGAEPTTVAVTTASGTESWKGFIFEEVMLNHGAPADSGRLLLAYRDADAHTLIVTVLLANGTFAGTSLMANDTVVVPASSASGSITHTGTGAACATPISGLTNPVITTAAQATCLVVTFSATFSASFPEAAGVDPALTQLSFPLTTFTGERFQDPSGALTSRVRSEWSRTSVH